MLAEICIILISYITIGVYVWRLLVTLKVEELFDKTRGNGYIRLDEAANLDQYYMLLIAFIVFFSTLKLIKLLQFNKRMDVLALTIMRCWNDLKIFFIAFAIVFFAFCMLFFFMFSSALEEFSRWIPAIQTSFKMMLGKFNFEAMKQANPYSPVLFFVFSVTNSMILINIMLTIILRAFNEIKFELSTKENKYDVIDFVWRTARQAFRLDPPPKNNVKPSMIRKKERKQLSKTEQLPDKVNTYICNLFNFILNIFFKITNCNN